MSQNSYHYNSEAVLIQSDLNKYSTVKDLFIKNNLKKCQLFIYLFNNPPNNIKAEIFNHKTMYI